VVAVQASPRAWSGGGASTAIGAASGTTEGVGFTTVVGAEEHATSSVNKPGARIVEL
jgi:hypothetical protein